MKTVLIANILFRIEKEKKKDMKILLGPALFYPQAKQVYVWWHTNYSSDSHSIKYGETKEMNKRAKSNHWGQYPFLCLSSLKLGTKYFYQVCSGETNGKIHTFITPKEQFSPFSFILWGDNQGGYETFSRYSIPAIKKQKPEFLIAVGDLVSKGNRHNDWQNHLYEPARKLLSSIPWFPIRGNHDGEYKLTNQMLPRLQKQCWYACTYQNMRIVILDTNLAYYKNSPQISWLKKELQSDQWKKAIFRIVAFHHPPFTSVWDAVDYDGEVTIRTIIIPLLEKAKTNLVVAGHAHSYQRGCRKTPYGKTYYLVTGGGGGNLDFVKVWKWNHFNVIKSCFHIVHATVTKEAITLKAIDTVKKNVFDSFVISAER